MGEILCFDLNSDNITLNSPKTYVLLAGDKGNTGTLPWKIMFPGFGQKDDFFTLSLSHTISPPPSHTERIRGAWTLLCYRNLRLNKHLRSLILENFIVWSVKCFTSSGQRLVEESLRGLAGAAVPSAHTASIFFSVGAQDVVAAHVLWSRQTKPGTRVSTDRVQEN